MKCPLTLKAGPYIYRVGLDKADENYGATHLAEKIILFGSGCQSGEQHLVTLIHEWFHIAEENSTVPEGSRMDHNQMRLLSTWVVDLLQQLGLDTNLDASGLPAWQLGGVPVPTEKSV